MDLSAYKTERKSVIKFPNVGNAAAWPKAQSDKCCIFEAINIVGAVMFGDAWTGQELCALYWDISPQEAEDDAQVTFLRAQKIPKAPPPPRSIARTTLGDILREKSAPHDAHVTLRALNRAMERHRLVVIAEQELWEANVQASGRLFKTVEWLGQKCRDKELPSFARVAIGGDLWPVHSWEWNTENPVSQFVSAGGSNRFFAELDNTRAWETYLFFARADIDRVTATLAYAPSLVAESDLSTLSPYLRFAIKMALSKKYTPHEGRASKDARIADFRAAWNEALPDVPITEQQLTMLANVTGWPNAEGIRRGLLGGRKRNMG